MANFYGYREINHHDEETMAFSILVCIKAVPDMSSGQKLVVEGDRIAQADIEWCMNSYDACALEAALAIKDAQSPNHRGRHFGRTGIRPAGHPAGHGHGRRCRNPSAPGKR